MLWSAGTDEPVTQKLEFTSKEDCVDSLQSLVIDGDNNLDVVAYCHYEFKERKTRAMAIPPSILEEMEIEEVASPS
tara:strand:+ start:489 stop:716 length:228 start_codon:yes stop_codon:yes gene_type:complete